MPSLFTQIINKTLPGHIVAEAEEFIAFLDIQPLAKGHTLVVPKQEIDYLFDLDDATLGGLMRFSKRIAQSIKKVVPCLRVGMAAVGLEVPHAHLHLVPLHGPYDIDFQKPRLDLGTSELAKIAAQLRMTFPS